MEAANILFILGAVFQGVLNLCLLRLVARLEKRVDELEKRPAGPKVYG